MIKKIYLIEISELFLCSSNILLLSSKPLHSSFFPLLNKFMVSRIAGFFDETDANYLSHFKITCSHNETRPQNSLSIHEKCNRYLSFFHISISLKNEFTSSKSTIQIQNFNFDIPTATGLKPRTT